MAYKNPILKEIVATLHFAEGSLVASNFFSLVPKLQHQGFSRVEVLAPMRPIRATNSSDQQQLSPQIQVQCWTEDDSKLAQLSTDQLSVNHVVKDEYLGWTKYRAEAFDIAMNAVNEPGPPPQVESAELVTIDEINAPVDDFSLGKYLNCDGEKIPRWYHNMNAASDISMGIGFLNVDRFNNRYKITTRFRNEMAVIRIESAFTRAVEGGNNAVTVLDELHLTSNDHFEALITDHTRSDVMGGAI